MVDVSMLYGFLVSLGIGGLIGIEREHDEKGRTLTAGVRTFALTALFGTSLALITEQQSELFPLILGLGYVALIAIGYVRTSRNNEDIGLTTEIAQLFVIALGFLAYYPETRTLSVILGILTAILLEIKEYTQEFAHRIVQFELRDSLKFMVISFIILPALPNVAVDPWRVLNPQKIWLLVVLISGISYFGYILVKLLGVNRGIGITGLLGGLTSSTAVTTAMAAKSKESGDITKPVAFATLIAFTIMYPRIILEVMVVNQEILGDLMLSIGVMFLAALISAIVIYRKASRVKAEIDLKTPFAISPALKFAAFFVIVLLLVHFTQTRLGDRGVYIAAAVSGLADVDAITLSMASLSLEGDVSADTAVNAITIAVMFNTIVKFLYALMLGTRQFARYIGIATAFILATGTLALIV
ncbi:MAG: MgtC/SapB family protein [Candidatus Altiarchaeota archaeon]